MGLDMRKYRNIKIASIVLLFYVGCALIYTFSSILLIHGCCPCGFYLEENDDGDICYEGGGDAWWEYESNQNLQVFLRYRGLTRGIGCVYNNTEDEILELDTDIGRLTFEVVGDDVFLNDKLLVPGEEVTEYDFLSLNPWTFSMLRVTNHNRVAECNTVENRESIIISGFVGKELNFIGGGVIFFIALILLIWSSRRTKQLKDE